MPPPGPTVLDRLQEVAVPVYAVGKIQDIFSGQGITEARYSDSNDHGVDLTIEYLGRPGLSLVFANLVDFDLKYGHCNDPSGYAVMEAFDRRLPELLAGAGRRPAADHGGTTAATRTTPPTDHSRERTPLLVAGLDGGPRDLGARTLFADLGQTVAALLGANTAELEGDGFLDLLGIPG